MSTTPFRRILFAALAALSMSAVAANSPIVQKTGTITTQNLVAGGAATAGSCVESDVATSGAVKIQVTGTYTAAGGLSLRETVNGTVWITDAATTTFTRQSTGVSSATITSGEQDIYLVAVTGARRIGICAGGAVTGTATVTIQPVELSLGGGASSGGGAVTNAGTFAVQPSGSVAHDGAAGSVNPVLVGCYSSAAAPTGVSTDADAVRAWCLANGARVIQISLGGVLASAGAGNSGTGTQRVTLATDDAAIAALQAALTATNTQLPTTIGPAAKAASLSVTGATDDPAALGIGGTADAAATAGSTGSVSAKLRTLTGTIGTAGSSATSVVSVQGIASGTPLRASIDQTTPGTTNLVQLPDSTTITVTPCSSTCTNVDLFTGVATTGYNSFFFQNTTSSGTYTITFQGSVDGTTFYDLKCQDLTATGATGSSLISTSSALSTYQCRAAPIIRGRITSYSSGTVQGAAVLSLKSIQPLTAIYAPASLTVNAGQAAHDAAISGNPVRIGARALTADYTAVATGDVADLKSTTTGALVVYPWAIPDATWQYASAADVTDTTSTEMKAAVASTRNYLKSCQFSNTDATVGTYVNVLSASTVIGVVYVAPQTASTAGHNSLPVVFEPPLRGAVNEAINFQAVTTSAQLRVACQGFISTH